MKKFKFIDKYQMRMRDFINMVSLCENSLSASAQRLLARVPQSSSVKVDIGHGGASMGDVKALKDAGLIDYTFDSYTFQATLTRKAAPEGTKTAQGVSISMLPAIVKADILDMCLGPNGPPALEAFWMADHGIMSFNETYLSQFLFGTENLNSVADDDGVVSVEMVDLNPDQLDNSRRSVSDRVVSQYTALTTPAPPILVKKEGGEWKLVEGGHRLAAAKARHDRLIRAVDVSPFFELSEEDWRDL